MTTSPVLSFFELTEVDGPVSEAQAESIYDQLEPVAPDFMIGKWTGHSFDTGHPTHKLLKDYQWAGKEYRDLYTMRTELAFGPRIMVMLGSLREVKFRGVVSTAMIYDKFPIIDIFRYVDAKTVMGAMDNKELPEDGTDYFYLTRL